MTTIHETTPAHDHPNEGHADINVAAAADRLNRGDPVTMPSGNLTLLKLDDDQVQVTVGGTTSVMSWEDLEAAAEARQEIQKAKMACPPWCVSDEVMEERHPDDCGVIHQGPEYRVPVGVHGERVVQIVQYVWLRGEPEDVVVRVDDDHWTPRQVMKFGSTLMDAGRQARS